MIRPLRSEDREQVIALVRATKNFSEAEVAIAKELIDICVDQPEQTDYYAYVASSEAHTAEANGSENVRKHVGDEGATVKRDQVGTELEVSGFLLLGPTPATTGTYDMYWIAVHPASQGRGIAQELDRFAEAFVRSHNGYLLIAETSSQPGYERTRAFYEKEGYRILAKIADYYKPFDDLIIYGKRFE